MPVDERAAISGTDVHATSPEDAIAAAFSTGTLSQLLADVAYIRQFCENVEKVAANAPRLPFMPDLSQVARK